MEHVLQHPDQGMIVSRNAKTLGQCFLVTVIGGSHQLEIPLVIIELSAGFLSFPGDDWVRLYHKIHEYDMKAKRKVGILLGTG